jgi:hypothetical protein
MDGVRTPQSGHLATWRDEGSKIEEVDRIESFDRFAISGQPKALDGGFEQERPNLAPLKRLHVMRRCDIEAISQKRSIGRRSERGGAAVDGTIVVILKSENVRLFEIEWLEADQVGIHPPAATVE